MTLQIVLSIATPEGGHALTSQRSRYSSAPLSLITDDYLYSFCEKTRFTIKKLTNYFFPNNFQSAVLISSRVDGRDLVHSREGEFGTVTRNPTRPGTLIGLLVERLFM